MGWAEERARVLAGDAPAALACLISGCPDRAIDIVYCAEHRRMADDGSLWLRCVNHPERPVAPFDPIVCPECRTRLDAIDMPGYPPELRRGAA